ncbi:membrane protein [Rhodopirellula maiorica SM1]|uniref:Membrane protein n=1 Tax=Rhodopirellula maiorica SM1 TaxID=1265738 RepID=M5S2Y7_9BACT|nr:membrane protein [Rhodopirellula maiorica SM1]
MSPEPEVEHATHLPDTLVKPTRYGLRLLAVFSIAFPLFLSPVVDGFRINPFSIVPLTVGFTVDNRSFKRFPLTAIACISFVLGFLGDCSEHSVMNVWNWLPARSSPLLAIRLLCATVGGYTAWMVWRCHRYHRSIGVL